MELGLDAVVSFLTADETAEFGLVKEEEFCRSAKIQFLSLPIPDRGVPRSRDNVLKLIGTLEEKLADGKTVGIQRRQGIGRSGLLAACLLVSAGLSPEAAFERLTQVRGCPVPETSEQRRWVEGIVSALAKASAG
jgi:protein-tyrosine phosphatase